MTRRLTVDDATRLYLDAAVPGIAEGGRLRISRLTISHPWRVVYQPPLGTYTLVNGRWRDMRGDSDHFPTAQAALDAAISAGAVIDEGDET